ncbi:MAG: GDP-mannose 4,6-dehydratase [Winogradskyella sp.]|nr:GDP-mannose 4,6-dehydratase [Winogradskyella sp.]
MCDKALVYLLFEKHHFNHVIHFGAESHVYNSINATDMFINTNIVGTIFKNYKKIYKQ